MQCDWSGWTDGKEWEEETKLRRLKTLPGLKKLHVYIGGAFLDRLSTIWERFQVCSLDVATITVQKNESQVYGYIDQSTVDACESMVNTILGECDEKERKVRLKQLEAKITTDRSAIDHHMSINSYERPGEDWFG